MPASSALGSISISSENTSRSNKSASPALEAALSIRSKPCNAESTSTEHSSDSTSQLSSHTSSTEERTLQEQIAILSKKVRRCSGMIQTQGNLLAAGVVSRLENDRLGAEKRKLKKDMDNLMKENIKFQQKIQEKEKVNAALLNLIPDEKCELRIIHDREKIRHSKRSGKSLEPSGRSARLRKSEHFKPRLMHGTANTTLNVTVHLLRISLLLQLLALPVTKSLARTPGHPNICPTRTTFAEEALRSANLDSTTATPNVQAPSMTLVRGTDLGIGVTVAHSSAVPNTASSDGTPTAELDGTPAETNLTTASFTLTDGEPQPSDAVPTPTSSDIPAATKDFARG